MKLFVLVSIKTIKSKAIKITKLSKTRFLFGSRLFHSIERCERLTHSICIIFISIRVMPGSYKRGLKDAFIKAHKCYAGSREYIRFSGNREIREKMHAFRTRI